LHLASLTRCRRLPFLAAAALLAAVVFVALSALGLRSLNAFRL